MRNRHSSVFVIQRNRHHPRSDVSFQENTRASKFEVTRASEDPFRAVLHAAVWLTCRHILRCRHSGAKLLCSSSDDWNYFYRSDTGEILDDSKLLDVNTEGSEAFIVPFFSFPGHLCLVLERNAQIRGQFRRIGFVEIDNYGKPSLVHGRTFPTYRFTTDPTDWEGNEDGVKVETDEEWGWSYTIGIV